jgi:hypothetical protein
MSAAFFMSSTVSTSKAAWSRPGRAGHLGVMGLRVVQWIERQAIMIGAAAQVGRPVGAALRQVDPHNVEIECDGSLDCPRRATRNGSSGSTESRILLLDRNRSPVNSTDVYARFCLLAFSGYLICRFVLDRFEPPMLAGRI